LTNVEVKWLEDHNSLEKVLSISSLAYASAPKWEAFPKSTLSDEDLKRIEEEKTTSKLLDFKARNNLKRKQMVNWIKTCCNDYKLIDSAVDGLAYSVFLTEQDYVMFTLKWE
jgi:hypothetical protein